MTRMIRAETQTQHHRYVLLGLLLVSLTLLAFTACGGSSEQSLTAVALISDILDGPIVVVEDITPTSAAVVRVDTNLPVVCSVVYGIDKSYGSQSTDLDMAGTVYVSEDRTFTTADAQVTGDPPEATNLAALSAGGSVVEASSSFGGSATWAPENAIDEDATTEWSSQGDGDDAFITIKLAGDAFLTGVEIWTRTMGTSAQIEQIRIVTDRGDIFGPFTLESASELFAFPADVKAGTLTFEVVSSSGGNTGLVELAAYGTLNGE